MQIDIVPSIPSQLLDKEYKPVPNRYNPIMYDIMCEFARRSGITIDSEGRYTGVLYKTLNGPLRSSIAWNRLEFFPQGFRPPEKDHVIHIDEQRLTVEQANSIISKLLEICEIEGYNTEFTVNTNSAVSYTRIQSVLTDAKTAGVVPQFFDAEILEQIIARLANEDYHALESSCRAACTGLCARQCGTSCVALCGGDCTDSCVGSCAQSCINACEQACGNACQSECTGACTNVCTSDCGSGCNVSCTNTCINSCHGTCGYDCETTCIDTCNQQCSDSCTNECTSNCQGLCRDGCTGGCNTTCISTCGMNCTGDCSSTCNDICTDTCSGACNNSCGNSCIDGCGKACGTTCTGACDGAVDAYHVVDNNYASPDHRD